MSVAGMWSAVITGIPYFSSIAALCLCLQAALHNLTALMDSQSDEMSQRDIEVQKLKLVSKSDSRGQRLPQHGHWDGWSKNPASLLVP